MISILQTLKVYGGLEKKKSLNRTETGINRLIRGHVFIICFKYETFRSDIRS